MCMRYNYLSEDCSAKESVYRFMKTLRASFFSLMIKIFTFSYCCTGLGAGWSTKETIDNFFRNQFKLNLENTRRIDFQCHVAKLSQ